MPVLSPGSIGRTCSSWPSGIADAERLAPQVAAVADVDDEPRGQRVDHGDADAVQATGDLVAAAAELAAGVQHGQRHGDRGHVLAGCGVGGDAAAVVLDPDAAVGGEGEHDPVAVSRPAPRRPRCPRSPRSGGAGRAHRWSRCTCPDACAPPRAPRGPGSRRRRTSCPRAGGWSTRTVVRQALGECPRTAGQPRRVPARGPLLLGCDMQKVAASVSERPNQPYYPSTARKPLRDPGNGGTGPGNVPILAAQSHIGRARRGSYGSPYVRVARRSAQRGVVGQP